MPDAIFSWLAQNSLLPHGYCIKWSLPLLSTYVISDGLITLSYYAIPAALGYFAWQRKDLIDYRKTLWLFAAFIIACGTTHLVSIFLFWQPLYWLDAGLKALTALISVITVIHLFPQIPALLRTPNPEHLLKLNQSLEQEIALRKHTEAALRKEKQLSDDIINSLPGVFYILNEQGNLVRWNTNLQEATGYSAEEINNRHALDFIVADDHTLIAEKIQEVFEKGSAVTEAGLLSLNGGSVPYYFSARRVDLEAQAYLIGLGSDFSEHKRMEEVLGLSELKFRTLFESSRDAIMMVSLEGTFIGCNPAAIAMFGYRDEQEFIGTSPVSTSPEFQPDGRRSDEKVEKLTARIMEEGSLFFEWLHRRMDGTEFLADVFVVRIEVGDQIMMQAVVRDITERKHAEETLKKAKAMAETTARIKTNFLANMSHEIRTPMNAVLGFAQLALNLDITPQVRGYLDKITIASQSLLQIINDILDLSKSEAGRMTLENAAFNLDSVLNALDSLFSARAQQKGLNFEIQVGPEVSKGLIGDKYRLQQILANLLSNAIKFTPHGKVTLKIQLKHQDNSKIRLAYSVEDTGIGMTQAECAQLFQPFNQADSSITRRFGGTGLGLVISRNLLRLMGGEFSIDSTPGVGSIFSFELVFDLASHTLHDAAWEAGYEAETHNGGSLTQIGGKLSGIRILVAEDNPTNQLVVAEFLQLSGAVAVCAENGIEALKKLEHGGFDAVLMDVHMPDMDGITATQRIRQQERYVELPIIALTAGVTAEEREHCLSCGMTDFIAKPIIPEQLIATLKRRLKSKPVDNTQGGEEHVKKAETTTVTHLPGFDLNPLLNMLDARQDKLIAILCRFRDEFATTGTEIDTQIEAGDMAEVKATIHTFKGAAGNIGATALHAITEQLENELVSGQFNPQTLSLFRKTFNETLSSLTPLRKFSNPMNTAPEPHALEAAVNELYQLLSTNTFIEEDILDNMFMLIQPDRIPLFITLREQIHNIRYTEARATLEQFKQPSTQKL